MPIESPTASRPAIRVGVDSGGTFTDICVFNPADGIMSVWKVSSTPQDPSVAIVAGISEALRERGHKAHDVTYFGHGTTVATNALIQNRLAKTGLITTKGFRDVVEIGRQRRPRLYDTNVERAPAIVSRDLRMEVDERLRFDGSVERPLDTEQLRECVRRLKVEGIGAQSLSASCSRSSGRTTRRWPKALSEKNFPTSSSACPAWSRLKSASMSASQPSP